MSYQDEYKALIEITNSNLQESGQAQIVFENPNNIFANIFALPIENLLEIESDREFIFEVYYKILDRAIDESTLSYLLSLLKYKVTNRVDIIKNVTNSHECEVKKTKVIFQEESKA